MIFMICSKHSYGVEILPWENFRKVIFTRKCPKCLLNISFTP